MYAGIDAGDPITHGVHAGEFWVGIGHIFEGDFATLQFLLVGTALGSAHLDEVVLWVLALFEHASDGASDISHVDVIK